MTTTEALGMKLFTVQLVESAGGYEKLVKRLVRAETLADAEEYVLKSGLPFYYEDQDEEDPQLGEPTSHNPNMFEYNCGDRVVVLKFVSEVPVYAVQAVETASEMGLCDFM